MVAVQQFGPHYFASVANKYPASATLKTVGGGSTVTTYDATGVTPTPIKVTRSGYVSFYAPTGTYDLHLVYASGPDKVEHVRVAASSSSGGSAELAAAVALLQDKATAATDAELAAAVDTITTALAAKQDASTAATDAELASAVGTINTALAAKAPLVSPVFTGTAPTVNGLTVLLPWTANTAYVAGQWAVAPGGYPIKRIADGTSGASYDPTAWTEYGGGKEIAASQCDVSGSFVPTNNTQQDVIQTGGALWQVQVPANSGGIMLLIPTLTFTVTTGANAATVSQRVTFYIVDEANVTVASGQVVIYGTGTTQSPAYTIGIGQIVANNAADKTYRVQMQVQRIGTGSASGALNSGGVFSKAVLQAVRR